MPKLDAVAAAAYQTVMSHPRPFRVPASRPSIEQAARDLGLSAPELARVTKLVDAFMVGKHGVTRIERQPERRRQRRALKRSRARVNRQRRSQRPAKRR